MDDNTLPNPTIEATGGTVTYTVTATSENAYCSQSASVTVTGIPAIKDFHGIRETLQGKSVYLDISHNLTGY